MGAKYVTLKTGAYRTADLARAIKFASKVKIDLLEDQIFKGLPLGAPYFKLIGMARAPLAAAMVGKTIGRRIAEGEVPAYIKRFGSTIEKIFIIAPRLKAELGKDFDRLPTGALGLYTYLQRLAQGFWNTSPVMTSPP